MHILDPLVRKFVPEPWFDPDATLAQGAATFLEWSKHNGYYDHRNRAAARGERIGCFVRAWVDPDSPPYD